MAMTEQVNNYLCTMRMRTDAMIGAIAGDIIGSPYEFNGVKASRFRMFDRRCRYTDDTVLTVAIANWLSDQSIGLQDYLVRYARTYYWVGYGGMFRKWSRLRTPKPYNSYGNGSAMRVSAVSCYADSIEEAMHLAKETALPTHNHPEGIKGAQATCVAAYLARTGHTKPEIKAKLQELFDYDLNRSFAELLAEGYKFHVTCQETVPPALISFFESESYEDCIAKAILTNKDTDTAAAVAGAVAGAYYGIPDAVKEQAMSHLTDEMKQVIVKFEEKLELRL